MVKKSENAYRNITEASQILGLKAHVLRFWESKFDTLNPMTRGGGRRFYAPEEIELLQTIKELLYERGMTIKAASKLIDKYGTNAIYLAPEKVTNSKSTAAPDRAPQNEGDAPEEHQQDVQTTPHPTYSADNLRQLQDIDLQLAILERRAQADIAQLDIMLEKLRHAA